MLGAIVGDLVGSVYEFKNYRAKDFQPLFHANAKFTDDTVCTVAIADALLNQLDPTVTLQAWCRKYWENGGWGQKFFEWIADDAPTPYGSYGNGGAMRVSSAGFLSNTLDEALNSARKVTEITHNHPEAIKGALATTSAIWWAREGWVDSNIRQSLSETYGYALLLSVDEIRPTYRHSEASQNTVPQAITCALEATDFEDAIRNAISIGGDSDTIAAIAGAIAEARFGVPATIARQAWTYLPTDMRAVLTGCYAHMEKRASKT